MTKDIVFEDKSCPMGCMKNDNYILTGYDHLHDLPGDFSVVKCSACGLMRTNPRPTPKSIGLYYPSDYGPYRGTRISTLPHRNRIKLKIKEIIGADAKALPLDPPGNMLEIGCASGSYLHEMSKLGWKVSGIEYSEQAGSAAIRSGYSVHIGALETAPQADEFYDIIVGWMVLEHLHEPIKSLKKLREWAKPNAWLIISVPNANSLGFKLFSNNWYDLHLPNHLYHFTPSTLTKVLDKSGWQVKKVYHQRSIGNVIASLGYALRDKQFKWLGDKLIAYPEKQGMKVLYPVAWLISLFGQTGRMTVWAKRKA